MGNLELNASGYSVQYAGRCKAEEGLDGRTGQPVAGLAPNSLDSDEVHFARCFAAATLVEDRLALLTGHRRGEDHRRD